MDDRDSGSSVVNYRYTGNSRRRRPDVDRAAPECNPIRTPDRLTIHRPRVKMSLFSEEAG